MPNVKFVYLYRDAGNYKRYGSVVFANPEGLSLAFAERALLQGFQVDGLFIAKQVRVPDVFLWEDGNTNSDDHCYHEFFELRTTDSSPDDVLDRSISAFISEVALESELGWSAFDVMENSHGLNRS